MNLQRLVLDQDAFVILQHCFIIILVIVFIFQMKTQEK